MRVPSVALMAALLAVAHAAPGQQLPPTPEIVRMFAEAADTADDAETSDSFESSSAEDSTSATNQAKRSYAVQPPAKQFCIEIRPKNPSQSPFVICEPPTQPYYQYPPPQNLYPYPHQPAPSYLPPPSAYPAPAAYPAPPAYPPPAAPSPPLKSTGGKPYQRSNAMTPNADSATTTMTSGLPSNNPGVAHMQQPPSVSPIGPPPMMMPPPGPVMTQPMPPSVRSSYPQPYASYDQPPPVTMQCHAQPGYQNYHGYQNPVALLQLFLKPSHHHHHHPGYYSAPAATPTETPSYRAAAVEGSTPKKNTTSSASVSANQTTESDNSTEGPLHIPIPIQSLPGEAAHPPLMTHGPPGEAAHPPLMTHGPPAEAAHPRLMTHGPHITPAGSHPESKDIPGITSPGSPNPMFRPGGGAALLKPSNASAPTLKAPKMAEADDALNMVDGPSPIERAHFDQSMMQAFNPAQAWAASFRSAPGSEMMMPENHVISGQFAVPIHSDIP